MPSVGTRAVGVAGAPVPEAPGDAADQGMRHRGPVPRWVIVGGLLTLVGLPLVVAAVALRRPHWYPVLDLAMTELRLRDVGTRHTPLIGLPGRIGPSLAEQGSHPGPLSFYVLTPFYRLFGSSAWAMQAATVVVNLAALGTALLIALRRGGTRLAIAVAALLVVLVSGYGLTMLTQPWNPYLPLLWWVVLLLAVWSVACGDLAMLPVAVFAASFCAQTHVPYLGLAAGLGVLTIVMVALAWRGAARGSPERRSIVRWTGGSLVLAVALWVPPLVDQAINDPGNLRAVYDHLVTPSEEPVGFGRGVELALLHLDIPGLVIGDSGAVGSLPDPSSDPNGSVVPGVVALVAWAAAAAVSLRLRHRPLVRLHLVVAVSLVLGVISMGRILGKEWYYLMLWAWGTAALLLLAVAWTVVAATSAWAGPRRRAVADAATVALVAVLGVSSVALIVDAVDTEPPEPHLSSTLGAVLPETMAALERGEGPATGRDGRYMVAFSDALYFGSQSYGLVSELERAGFDAGMTDVLHVPITDHRVIGPDDATALVVLATGHNIDRWRERPEAVEVAYVEPRDARERAEFTRLRTIVIDDLRADGLDDIVPLVDDNLFGASIDERVSDRAQRLMTRMLELGERTAVFVAPPDTIP
ncbi:MAG TPA: hypothetical protein VFG94_10130 [Acidimicrobiales bacterium]|nr:hypothetical protein [Acidimicrobiales bacterium]